MAGATPARLDQLTSLRFFAALAVLSSHLWPLAEEPNALQPLAKALFAQGYAGVSFFFMLSGFILAHTYRGKLRDGRISWRKYLALRVARIAPLHWIVAAPFAVMTFVGLEGAQHGVATLPRIAVTLALLQSWVPDSGWYFSLVGPSWSLSDELFFYTCFVGLAFLSRRRLAWLVAGLLVADAALVGWRIASGAGAAFGEAPTLTHWLTYILPVTRLADFAIGMLVWLAPRPPARWATLQEIGVLVALIAALVLAPMAGVPEAARMQIAYLPFMAAVIAVFGNGRGAVSRLLAGKRWLVLLGDASFALYLIHYPIIAAVFERWEAMDDQPPVIAVAAGVTLAAVVLSVAIFRWIETPLLRASRRLIDRALPK